MKTYNRLYTQLCSLQNLESAFKKARKGKTQRGYTIKFEKNLKENLLQLHQELKNETYRPLPLKIFILRDPKTRKISVSDFRDRVIHHALVNILEPIFESFFIYDSYASRKGKGTSAALKRFDQFKRKVSHNNTQICFVLKADIKHYFEEVDHQILIKIISRRIKDQEIINLIKLILENHKTKISGKGIPLGNYTSQFFANVYLNKLDYFVKHQLKAKYYLRYVDDLVILDCNKTMLEEHKEKINCFLREKLALELHPEKSRIIALRKGIGFLGFRLFPCHRLIARKNLRQFYQKLQFYCKEYEKEKISYDTVYDFLEGWTAYAKNANTYKIRQNVLQFIEKKFAGEISAKEVNKYSKTFSRWSINVV